MTRRFHCARCGKYSRRADINIMTKVRVKLYDDDPLTVEIHRTVDEDELGAYLCIACGAPVTIKEGDLQFVEMGHDDD